MPSVASEPSAVTASMRAPARPHPAAPTDSKGAASPFASLLDATSPPEPPPAPQQPTAKSSQSSSQGSKDARNDTPRPSDPPANSAADRSPPDPAPTDDPVVVADGNPQDPTVGADTAKAQDPAPGADDTGPKEGKKSDDDAAALLAPIPDAQPSTPSGPVLAVVITPAPTEAPPASPPAADAAPVAVTASATPAVVDPATLPGTDDGDPEVPTTGDEKSATAAVPQQKPATSQVIAQASTPSAPDEPVAIDPSSVPPGTKQQKTGNSAPLATGTTPGDQKTQTATDAQITAAPAPAKTDAAPTASPDPNVAKPAGDGHADETPEAGHGPAHVGTNEAVKHAQQTLANHTEPATAPNNAPTNVPLLHAHEAVQATAPMQSANPQPSMPASTPAVDPNAMAGLPAVPVAGLAVDIAARFQAGRNRFEIRLDPPELGRVDVRLDVDRDGKVTSRLVVDKQETLDLLRRDAPQLERALQQAGFKTGDGGMQFSLRDQSFSGQNQGRSDTPADASRIVLPDEDLAPVEAVRGYGRLLGGSTGVDIRV